MSEKTKNALKEFARALLAALVALVTSLLTGCNIHNNSYPRDPYAVTGTRASVARSWSSFQHAGQLRNPDEPAVAEFTQLRG